MDPALLVAVLAFVAIAGAGIVLTSNNQPTAAGKRVKAVAATKSVDRRKQATEVAALKRRQSASEALKELSNNEKQSRKRRFSVKGQIAQAGLTISPAIFWAASAGTGLVLGVVGFIVQIGADNPMFTYLAAGMGFFIGFLGLPRWFIGMLVSGRQKKFSNQLADGIDIIVRGVKSGLPLNQCMRIIAQESPEPLRTEFQSLVDAGAMGVPMDQSLQRMYDRMPLAEVNFFAIVLVIQQKTGGNLSESLGNLSAVLRSRKLMKEKVKALSSEAQASAMIIGSLPLVVMAMVYFTRPSYIMILFIEPVGNLILLGAATMMAMGVFVMNKMVNFKF